MLEGSGTEGAADRPFTPANLGLSAGSPLASRGIGLRADPYEQETPWHTGPPMGLRATSIY